MIHIKKVVMRIVRMELVTPFETSSARITHKDILLMEWHDASGIRVMSECVAKHIPNYTPETVDTAFVVLKKHILPLIMHQDFDTPQSLTNTIQRHVRGNLMAVASADMAAWAIMAEQQGISLSKAIGGVKQRIACGIALGIQASPQALAEVVAKEMAEGYHKIKLKIKPGQDINYVQCVRDTLGNDVPLMVDANNAYTLNDIPILKELDSMQLMMIEQPLAWDDIIDHAQLQAQMQTPICLDESIFHVRHAEQAMDLKSTQIINIKPGRVGGYTESLKIHDACHAQGVPVWCGGMLETGIGRAYNVALASKENFTLPGDVSPSKRYWAQDIVSPEWTMAADGFMAVPTHKPGLGVDICYDAIEACTQHKEEIT